MVDNKLRPYKPFNGREFTMNQITMFNSPYVIVQFIRCFLTVKPIGLMITVVSALATMSSQAAVSDQDIAQFASRMTTAANNKNIAQVSNLVAEDALISVSRKGKTSTLNKANYLNLLQSNWAKAGNYRYSIVINNVVKVGDQAKADVVTTEVLTEQGVAMHLVTTSRTTFSQGNNGLVLMRAICQLSIEQK